MSSTSEEPRKRKWKPWMAGYRLGFALARLDEDELLPDPDGHCFKNHHARARNRELSVHPDFGYKMDATVEY